MKIRGVGFNPGGMFAAKVEGRMTKEYDVWYAMLTRCYCPRELAKMPTYAGCEVAPEFWNFQDFAAWANRQAGWSLPGYAMDKDLLRSGPPVYSPDTVVFVPGDLNAFLTAHGRARGPYPQGVSWSKWHEKFRATISAEGKLLHLGYFERMEDAMATYAARKTLEGRKWASRLLPGSVDQRVIDRLKTFEFTY